MPETFHKVYRWVVGAKAECMKHLSRSLSAIFVGNEVSRQGNRQGNMRGVPAGGVVWPVDPATHDHVSFIAADAFFAEYDAKKREVYCLDDIGGARHAGADPLRVGRNVEIHAGEKRSGRGIVVRSAEYGTAGLYKNIFIHADADLIAHHRQPDPPDNSSLVHDPGEGPDDWAGGLHYPLRVRKWIESFCQGRTTSGDQQLYAPLFNFTRNGDGTVAHGAAHFAQHEATLSHEASGPLRPSAPKHELGHTGDSSVRAGAIDVKAYFGDGTDGFTGPITFSREPWKQGKKYLYETHPELRYDKDRLHDFNCGARKGVFDLWDTVPMTVYDPPPTVPPPETPPPPTVPPGDPVEDEPPTIIGPNQGEDDFQYPDPFPSHKPSVAAPQEVETPSAYKHPRPGIPDDIQPERARDDGTRDGLWRAALGFTEKDWMETPIVAHEDSMPVYESSTANENGDGPAGRWPTVKKEPEIVLYAQDGTVLGRHPALGPGSVIDMPANMNASHTLVENNGAWPTSPADHARIVFAAGLTAGSSGDGVVDGRLGIGRRDHTSPFVASGWEFSLAYDGAGNETDPDLYLWCKDAEAANSSTGKFYINGSEAGTGDVSGPASSTDNAVARFDGTGGKTLQNSGVTIDDSNNLAVPGSIKSSADNDGVGYATGAGGTVTQGGVFKTQGVTLNKICGQITTNTASLAAGAEVSFTVTNSTVASTDVVLVNHSSGGTLGSYMVQAHTIADGSFKIVISNLSTGALGEALVLGFAVIKAVTS